ncbi:Rad9 [Babesia ovata]|uniref:Rad9 n=1 Tax=Babesia ovata TaxID=189622 RepID=A0A2H6K6S5_9APIC|nr:Rad9 [Babesia ovata]GBE58704.1 Rad9 [Babesia ovata]
MEYELNASHTLLLKKIFILFRHVSSNIQIVATNNGLNLYALNGSNSAWLHIQLGKQFFRSIQLQEHDQREEDGFETTQQKYWLVSTKNICQALSIVSPAGYRSQGYCAVFLKDVGQGDDNTVRTTVALEKLVIREEAEHGNVLSFILSCAGEHIQRSAIISYEEQKLSVPDDVDWLHWHYLRIQPTILYKSINPYWSPFDDIAIAYDSKKDHVSLTIVKSSVKNAGRTKTRAGRRAGISGKITINSSHFLKLKFDESVEPPKDIIISLKELLSLSSFCESLKSPLSLLLRHAGDPVIVLFGEAVDLAENTTGQISIHQIIAEAAGQEYGDAYDTLFLTNQNKAWSGSLWLSSIQQENNDAEESTQIAESVKTFGATPTEYGPRTDPASVSESFTASVAERVPEPVQERVIEPATSPVRATPKSEARDIYQEIFEEPSPEKTPTQETPPGFGNLSRQQRDLIYRTLALDFMPGSKLESVKATNSNVGSTPIGGSEYESTLEGSLDSAPRDREETVYDQLAGIW